MLMIMLSHASIGMEIKAVQEELLGCCRLIQGWEVDRSLVGASVLLALVWADLDATIAA